MKRLGIFIITELNGIVDDYIMFFLSELKKVLDDLNEAKVNQIVKVLNRIYTSEDLHEQLKKFSDSKRQPDNRNQFSFSHDLSREII